MGTREERNLRHEIVWYLRHIVITEVFLGWWADTSCHSYLYVHHEVRWECHTSRVLHIYGSFLKSDEKQVLQIFSSILDRAKNYQVQKMDLCTKCSVGQFVPLRSTIHNSTKWKSGIVSQAKSARILSSSNVMLMGTCLGFSSVIHSALWTTNSMKDFYSD